MLITVGGAIYSPLPTTEMLVSPRDSPRLTQMSLASPHLQINLHSHFSSCLPSEAAFSKSPFHWAVSYLLAAAYMDKEEEERRSGSQGTPLHVLFTCQEVTVWVWMLEAQKHPVLRNMLTLFCPLSPEHPTLWGLFPSVTTCSCCIHSGARAREGKLVTGDIYLLSC